MFFMFACRPLTSYCNNLCKYSSEYGLMVRICTEQSLYVDGSVISYKVSLDGIKSSVDLRMSSLPYTLWDSCKLSHFFDRILSAPMHWPVFTLVRPLRCIITESGPGCCSSEISRSAGKRPYGQSYRESYWKSSGRA